MTSSTRPIADPTTGACGPVELNITSTPHSLPVVRAAVERMARTEGFSETDAHALTWAIDEALSNVIRHGYQNQPNQPITVSLEAVRGPDGRVGLCIIIRDMGRQVDLDTIQSRDLDEIRPGGLGVHVIRSIMDEVEYSCPPDGGMKLKMIKYPVRPSDPSSPAPRKES